MSELRLPPKNPEKGLEYIMQLWQRKIRKGILPPDPARVLEFILRTYPNIEHATPLPPLVEYVHANFTEKIVEGLPRLPMTADFPKEEWLRWIQEAW